MELMKYVSKRGREIVFDDWEDERDDPELGGLWVEICPHCHNKYKGILKGKVCNGGSGVGSCGVDGCWNDDACYYVDFKDDEVEFFNEDKMIFSVRDTYLASVLSEEKELAVVYDENAGQYFAADKENADAFEKLLQDNMVGYVRF